MEQLKQNRMAVEPVKGVFLQSEKTALFAVTQIVKKNSDTGNCLFRFLICKHL